MLIIKKSRLPNAGKGLFTTTEIRKDETVCEYKGEKVTWAECEVRNQKLDGHGNYYFYVNKNNCVDAQNTPQHFGRYANDAAGIGRVPGIRNNSIYVVRKGVPFIVATRRIKAGEEIYVSYGRSYWNIVKQNMKK